MGTENHLKADPNLLDGKLYVNPIKEKPGYIPQIKWECPPKFTLDPKWCVAEGEESREVVVQRDRLILLGEVDPTHSAIPSSPSGLIYMNEYHDDSKTPLIPLSPIEEEEEANRPTDTTAPFWTAASSESDQPKVPAIQGDMMAAAAAGAAAALTALTPYLKRKDEGNVIDTDLLIQFLNNPKTVEKLINEHGGLSNAGSEHASMQNEVTSSVPLPSSKPNKVMKTNINEHGVPVNTGVNISGSKAVTPSTSFLSAKPELEMMKSTHVHVPPTELATIPMSPPLSLPIGTTISEHSVPANTHVRISTPQTVAPFMPFPISKPELKILKLTDEHVPPPRAITIPIARSQLPPLRRVTDYLMLNKNLINDRRQRPPFESSQLTGPTPVAPFNDRRQQYPFESFQLTGSTPVAPFVLFPNSEPNGLKFKRLVNEYGASDRTRSQLMPGTRPVTPLVPFSFPKNTSVLPRANMQPTANALHHMRLLSSDVCQPPFLGGPAPMSGAKLMAPLFPQPSSRSDSFVWPMANPHLTANGLQSTLHTRPLSSDVHPPPFLGGTAPPMPGTKLMEPFVPHPSPRTNMFVSPMANPQPTANVLQSGLHRSPLPSTFVQSSPFVGATAPPMNHENYIKSQVRQYGGMQGIWDYGLHSLIGLLNNQIGRPELVQNINSSASMPKHQKPCIYFNGPRGCRNGSSCQYQHIMSDRPKPSGVSEPPPSAKKMKVDGVHGETSGRM